MIRTLIIYERLLLESAEHYRTSNIPPSSHTIVTQPQNTSVDGVSRMPNISSTRDVTHRSSVRATNSTNEANNTMTTRGSNFTRNVPVIPAQDVNASEAPNIFSSTEVTRAPSSPTIQVATVAVTTLDVNFPRNNNKPQLQTTTPTDFRRASHKVPTRYSADPRKKPDSGMQYDALPANGPR